MTVRKIKTYKLDSEKALPYFLDHIMDGKTLAEKILKKIDLKQGSFFTILPQSAIIDKLFNFNEGGIIPSVPLGKKSYRIEGRSSPFHPRKVITMDQECSEFIAHYLNKGSDVLAVLENYIMDTKSRYINLENVKIIPFDVEVYYFLDKNNSTDEIYNALRKSSQAWHFLGVLITWKAVLPVVLTDLIMDQICENVQFVIAGAYDGEGYMFWERAK